MVRGLLPLFCWRSIIINQIFAPQRDNKRRFYPWAVWARRRGPAQALLASLAPTFQFVTKHRR